MDRADRAGLGVALIGHVLLFGALSLSLLRPTPKLPPMNPAIEVALVDAKALQTAAPDAVQEASAPPAAATAPAAPMAPPEPIAAPPPPKPVPAPPQPKAVTKAPVKAALQPTPKPTPAAAQKAATSPQKKAAAAAPPRTSRLGGMGAELSQAATRENDRPGTGRGTAEKGSGTPAAKTAAQLEASFIQALFVKIKKYWRAPTGVDAELLRSNLVVTLNRDGTIGSVTVVSQSGENENNANLKALHAERAVNAVRRAAPFELPPEHYAIWQSLGPITFDKRLN
jgi:outer membrane biosynthesis protein TonB